MMRNTFMFKAAALVGALLAASPLHAAPVSTSKLVLRLPYRADLAAGEKQPYSIGAFENEERSQVGNFLGADWQGNFYVSDPIAAQTVVMRQFDKLGKLRQSWTLPEAEYAQAVAVTQDGYIWVSANKSTSPSDGIDLMIFKSGQKQPLADWRARIPKTIQEKLAATAKLNKLPASSMQHLRVYDIEAGNHRVIIQLLGDELGAVNHIGRAVWLLCDSRHQNVVQTGIVTNDIPFITPNDTHRWQRTDYTANAHRWHKLWIWDNGDKLDQATLDLNQKPEPYAPFLTIKRAHPPTVRQDLLGHMYLIWSRENSEVPTGKIVVGKKIYDGLLGLPSQDELALLVLNSQHKVVTYLPWTPAVLLSQQKWIKPVPDGSGFYRIEFAEKEARIYFHPLPKS